MDWLRAVVASARAEVFGRSGRWPVPLVDLECMRLEALLRTWLEVESIRPSLPCSALSSDCNGARPG